MIDESYPVRIHCPIADTVRTVYFLPVKIGEKYTVHIDHFNGCEEESQAHPECAACKAAAFEIMRAAINHK